MIAPFARRIVIISAGLAGAAPGAFDSRGEIVCGLPGSDNARLTRIAALQVDDPILVHGTPIAWSDRVGVEKLLLDRCSREG